MVILVRSQVAAVIIQLGLLLLQFFLLLKLRKTKLQTGDVLRAVIVGYGIAKFAVIIKNRRADQTDRVLLGTYFCYDL